MKLSYEGIGQWAATFACTGVSEGSVVKVGANGTVSACAAGEAFCGTVSSVSHGGEACSVVLGGLVTAAYSGIAPTLGYGGLSADGQGGVKADTSGRSYLIVDMDTGTKTVTFVL